MKIIVIGNGGHSKVIQEMIYSIKGHRIVAILDDKYTHITEIKGVIYSPLDYFKHIYTQQTKVIIAIGNNKVRKKVVSKLNLPLDTYISLIHPTALISQSARIGLGTVVMPGAFVTAKAMIGNHAIINTGSIVEHESRIADFVHISPNATLTGNVSVDEGVHIGASATVIPSIHIKKWSIIGAGATVISNIPAYSKAVGCPARLIISVDRKEKQKIR